jgi:hypothetical protein
VLVAIVLFTLRRGVRFRSMSLRFIGVLSIAVFLFGFAIAFTSWSVPFSLLLAVGSACYVFLSLCGGAWLADKELGFVERRMAERPGMKNAMEKNLILRTVWRSRGRIRHWFGLRSRRRWVLRWWIPRQPVLRSCIWDGGPRKRAD